MEEKDIHFKINMQQNHMSLCNQKVRHAAQCDTELCISIEILDQNQKMCMT